MQLLGGIFTFNRIGGFVTPWLMGAVMTATGAASGFYLTGGLAIIPAILVAMVRETGRRAQAVVAPSGQDISR